MGLRKGRRAATDSGLITFEEVEAYREAGRLDEAIPALERTLSYYVRNIGPRDPDTVTVRCILPSATRNWIAYPRPSTSSNLHSQIQRQRSDELVEAYRKAGQSDDCIRILQAVLADAEGTLSPDHPVIEMIRTNLTMAMSES